MFLLAKMLCVNKTLLYVNLFSNSWSGKNIYDMFKTAMEKNDKVSKLDIRTSIKYDPYSKTIARAAYRNKTLYDLLIDVWRSELYVEDETSLGAKRRRMN